MKTGAKIVFMATEIESATRTFCQHNSPLRNSVAPSIPANSRKTGVPAEKIFIAMQIAMPRKPQTIIRGIMPKVLLEYSPVRILSPIISPMVERMANLKKLMMIPCSRLNDEYALNTESLTKKGRKRMIKNPQNKKSFCFIIVCLRNFYLLVYYYKIVCCREKIFLPDFRFFLKRNVVDLFVFPLGFCLAVDNLCYDLD